MRKFTAVNGTARQAIRRKPAPRVLVWTSGIKRCRIWGANTAKQATKQADMTTAVFQEKKETERILL